MKKIQVDFCNREQTVPGNKNWPHGEEAFSRETIHLSLWCRAFNRALKTEKLKHPLFPGPVGAGTTNDCCSRSGRVRYKYTFENAFMILAKGLGLNSILFV